MNRLVPRLSLRWGTAGRGTARWRALPGRAAAPAGGASYYSRLAHENVNVRDDTTHHVDKLGRPSGTPSVPPAAATRDGRPPPVPPVAPATAEDVNAVASFIRGSERLLVITGPKLWCLGVGAGCSTESNIPDYRSPGGAYSSGFKPMSHQEFMRSDGSRRRYWARSYVGWQRFSAARCNAAHHALAQLEGAGRVKNIITQNVDRLHHQAGSKNVLELHGTTHEVVCMGCGAITPRVALQSELARRNPAFVALADRDAARLREGGGGAGGDRGAGMRQRPDGDVELEVDFSGFDVPACDSCGGFLKPNVVFFGDNLPSGRTEETMSLAAGADAVLVVGSSLMTLSSYRLVRAAKEEGRPVCILNVGETRADELADLKVESLAGEVLPRVEAIGGWWV